MTSSVIFLKLYFFTRMWRSTQTRPRPWPTPWTWPRWMASPTSTRCCASWPPAAWCRPSTSAREWTVTSTTTASLLPYTHTSHRLLGGLKSCPAPPGQMHFDIQSFIWTFFLSVYLPPPHRYADIIVHRLLAVAIGADTTYPDLMDKHKQSALSNNLNYRHKMAQYAQRASVAFHTQVNTYRHTSVFHSGAWTKTNPAAVIILENILKDPESESASSSFHTLRGFVLHEKWNQTWLHHSAEVTKKMVFLQLFFKSRGILNEEGFVLFVRKNAIIVLIPKFGLEGTVFFDSKEKAAANLVFNEEVKTHHFI